MRFNGIKPIERSQITFGDEHEPSLTAVEPGLDRPIEELGIGMDQTNKERVPAIMVASVIGLAFGLKASDKLLNLKARLTKPRGEF